MARRNKRISPHWSDVQIHKQLQIVSLFFEVVVTDAKTPGHWMKSSVITESVERININLFWCRVRFCICIHYDCSVRQSYRRHKFNSWVKLLNLAKSKVLVAPCISVRTSKSCWYMTNRSSNYSLLLYGNYEKFECRSELRKKPLRQHI